MFQLASCARAGQAEQAGLECVPRRQLLVRFSNLPSLPSSSSLPLSPLPANLELIKCTQHVGIFGTFMALVNTVMCICMTTVSQLVGSHCGITSAQRLSFYSHVCVCVCDMIRSGLPSDFGFHFIRVCFYCRKFVATCSRESQERLETI